MTTHIELILPSDVDDAAALRVAFARVIEILDGLVGEPVQGWVYGSDDLGANPTEHIRPRVNAFRLTADEVREDGPGV
jgi:hypothetical protein